jgi:hypothetical protein
VKRIVRETNRRCDGCTFAGEVFLVAIGNKSFRCCNVCLCEVERLRIRVHTEKLDSLETTR